jgi:predicted anti-sigma-YlaC factor YlaD
MQMRDEDPAHLFPLVQRHLDMCPECREEFEALLAALEVSAYTG